MNEEQIKQLSEQNYRLLFLLGVATCMIVSPNENVDKRKNDVDYFLKAIQAVVYENKPLPPMNRD